MAQILDWRERAGLSAEGAELKRGHLGYVSHFLHRAVGRLRPGEEQQPPKVTHPVSWRAPWDPRSVSGPLERAGLGVVPWLGGCLLLGPTHQP